METCHSSEVPGPQRQSLSHQKLASVRRIADLDRWVNARVLCAMFLSQAARSLQTLSKSERLTDFAVRLLLPQSESGGGKGSSLAAHLDQLDEVSHPVTQM